MKNNHVIARRYAKALLQLSTLDELEHIEKEFGLLVSAANSSDDFINLFSNPSFSFDDKKNVLSKICKESGFSKIFTDFLFVLLNKNRVKILDLIYKSFVLLVDENKKRLRVAVQSATKLDEQTLENISQIFSKALSKNVIIDSSVNKDLIGGICVKTLDFVFDGTVKNRLNILKEGLLKEIG